MKIKAFQPRTLVLRIAAIAAAIVVSGCQTAAVQQVVVQDEPNNRRGEGVAEEKVEAARTIRLAAEQGESTAQFNLAMMYATGEGVPEDYVQAARWFRLAAEQGHVLAQALLGAMYNTGEGVPKDELDAYAWLSIAAAQGNTTAKEHKEFVAEHMPRAQIAEAQKRSREYWTRYVVPFQ